MGDFNEVHENEKKASLGKQKKERTEAQIRATEKMKARRQEELKNREKDLMSAAEEMYEEKKKRQKQKREDLEQLLDSRLEKYHSKFLDEINKPLDAYWANIFNEPEPTSTSNPVPPPERAPETVVATPVQESRPPSPEPPKPPKLTPQQEWEAERLRTSTVAAKQRAANRYLKQDFRQEHDFSKWLPRRL